MANCTSCGERLPCTCGLGRRVFPGSAQARALSVGAPLAAFTRVLADVNREMVDREATADLERRLEAQRPRA